jgi:ATP-dependent RNA helicase HelY
VLTDQRQVKRLTLTDCPDPVTAIERITIPGGFSHRSPQHRKDLAATLRNKLAGLDMAPHRRASRAIGADAASTGESAIADLRAKLRRHPCHDCQDREIHARQAEKYLRHEREAAALDQRVASRSHVIARTFGRVRDVLTQLGYLDGDTVTAQGRILAGLYSELDLLAAECMRRGIWDGLTAGELAACVCALTFESRRADDTGGVPRLPGGRVRDVLAAMTRLWAELDSVERRHKLSFLREPDLGFAWTAHAWAQGRPLELVLSDDLTPGDFVRAIKQLIDLLDQIGAAAGNAPVASTARAAVSALRRGVVAYASVQ